MKFGPILTTAICDIFSSLGSNAHLDNKAADHLNTNIDRETAVATATRLTGQMPPDAENMQPIYNPVFDAYCFIEDYREPHLSSSQQHALYSDYKVEFDKINDFTTDVSVENNSDEQSDPGYGSSSVLSRQYRRSYATRLPELRRICS